MSSPCAAETQSAGDDGCDYDLIIVGAGFSGIGAAFRISQGNPGIRYRILERRDRVGGTWDLFRYPGVRSDSSIFALSFPWEPWTREEEVADGADIRDYLENTARKHGIFEHIRFRTQVHSADWDSGTDMWTVRASEDGCDTVHRARFVFFGSGYYDYDAGYTPEFPGIGSFAGTVVHPQHWPEDLACSGKKIVVIGSGATAVSLVPALARTAAKVTMLQRSPGYLFAGARVNPLVEFLRGFLPVNATHRIARFLASTFEALFWTLARSAPALTKRILRTQNVSLLPPEYPVDLHFKPRYNPWDQRLCLVADGDLFAAISAGRVEMVTDHVDHIDAGGIALTSGSRLDADVIVTATGLRLRALGGVRVSIDGTEVKPQERFSYKSFMLEDVPNLIWCIGYTNASWTLRADMTARAAARLIRYMRSKDYTRASPHIGNAPVTEKPLWDLQAGYVLRNPHALPKSASRRPWIVRQNYFADALDSLMADRVDEDMAFGRAGSLSDP